MIFGIILFFLVPLFSILVHVTVVARSIKRVTENQRDNNILLYLFGSESHLESACFAALVLALPVSGPLHVLGVTYLGFCEGATNVGYECSGNYDYFLITASQVEFGFLFLYSIPWLLASFATVAVFLFSLFLALWIEFRKSDG
ncbi:MAG: hypothetical protein AAGM21_13655 [Pseudomonadota bacterium]